MKIDIKGNPGNDNTFQETNVKRVDNYNPNARTVITNNYNATSVSRPMIITQIINRINEANLPYSEPRKPDTVLFDIQPKIDFNSLKQWAGIIREYAIYAPDVGKIYREFDTQGKNRSLAVLRWLNHQYLELSSGFEADELFYRLKEKVYKLVHDDPTCDENMYEEELDECLNIVLTDAFMRCQIFKKPNS